MEKKDKRKWCRLAFAIVIVIVVVICFRFFLPHIYKQFVPKMEDFYKESISRIELVQQDRDYIIVKYQAVTGFQWKAVGHHRGGLFPQDCHIIFEGVDSPTQLLSVHFFQVDNQFIFYVSDYEDVETEHFGIVPTYTVTDWTVLFPIKREPFSGGSERYITDKDKRFPED